MNWDKDIAPALSKQEYIATLDQLLAELPAEERAEALIYYEEYFDDAGTDQAERVLSELGPPEQLAAQIKSGYGRNYQDLERHSSSGNIPARPEDAAEARRREEAARAAAAAEAQRQAAGNEPQQEQEPPAAGERGSGQKLLLILLIILAAPILLPLLITACSLVASFFAVLVSLLVAAVGIAVALLVGGITLIIFGIGLLFVAVWDGVISLGAGLVMVGVALLAILAAVGICGKLFPALIRLLVRIVRWPFKRREGAQR